MHVISSGRVGLALVVRSLSRESPLTAIPNPEAILGMGEWSFDDAEEWSKDHHSSASCPRK